MVSHKHKTSTRDSEKAGRTSTLLCHLMQCVLIQEWLQKRKDSTLRDKVGGHKKMSAFEALPRKALPGGESCFGGGIKGRKNHHTIQSE